MTSSASNRRTATLTRETARHIIVHMMGWEEEDLAIFWRQAMREQRNPGCTRRAMKRQIQEAFERYPA